MLSLDEYVLSNNISRATAYRNFQKNNIPTVNINGRTFIVQPENFTSILADPRQLKALISNIKKELNTLIAKAQNNESARADAIELIQKEIERWASRGVKITGYSAKSVYRKINKGKEAFQRKTRNDKHCYKNNILKDTLENKILPLAAHIYITKAIHNINLVCDEVLMYAKTDEDYWEVAAVPKATLYRALRTEFFERGLAEKHKYLNHYNLWKNQRAYTTGAFTSSIKFMDYIFGDDHKKDIAGALVWNEKLGKFETLQVNSWFWIEAKTQEVLSYVIKSGSLTADDVITSLMAALRKSGAPNTGIIVDNGIGASEEVKEFCRRLEIELILGRPYTPTDKATIERCFQYIKTEHDVELANFVGSKHNTEGRHTGLSMSPEQTTILFEEYTKRLSSYINGMYRTRPRQRVTDGQAQTISIGDYYDRYMTNYNIDRISDRQLRYAYAHEKDVLFVNKISFKHKGVLHTFIPATALGVVYNNRRYIIMWNPNDLKEIDVYCKDEILNRYTGEIHEKGSYLTTMYNIALSPSKQLMVANYNKECEKAVRELAFAMVDKDVTNTINNSGNIVNVRKDMIKETVNIIKQELPVEKIKIAQDKIQKGEEIYSELTFTQDAETEEESSLTFEDEA
jgi:transposase InsO family protein